MQEEVSGYLPTDRLLHKTNRLYLAEERSQLGSIVNHPDIAESFNGPLFVGPEVVLRLREATQTVNNSTTLVDDDVFSWRIRPFEKWMFNVNLHVGHLSGQLKLTAIGPTGSTVEWGASGESEATGAEFKSVGSVAGATTHDFLIGIGVHTVSFNAVCLNDVNHGDFKLQWAQETAVAVNLVMHIGSSGIGHRLRRRT